MKRIIIFIDSFRFVDKRFLTELSFLKDVRPMRPSLGYSVNLHYELFQGLSPKQLGFFGDFVRSERGEYVDSGVVKVLSLVRKKLPFLMRVLYKIYSKITGKYVAFIPPSLFKMFRQKGKYLLQIESQVTIGGVEYTVLNHDKDMPFGGRDKQVFLDAMREIDNDNQNLLVTFSELDSVCHSFSVGSQRCNEKIKENIGYIRQLYDAAHMINTAVELVVVSDHGMINTKTAVNFELEDKFGLSGSAGVTYFYDSLYLSIWNDGNIELFLQMISFLEEQECGEFVSGGDRIRFKIDEKLFGDKIYLLNPGFGFAPNYFGYSLMKSFHGYHPSSSKENLGVIASTKPLPKDEFSTYDVFEYLQIYSC